MKLHPLAWWGRARPRQATKPGHIPESVRRHVQSIDYWRSGASLELTRAGIDFGCSTSGAECLAQVVMTQAEWQGTRAVQDVAREIKAHCVFWVWLPPLRGRANPVDLEFFQSWPRNLLISFRLSNHNDSKRQDS